VVVAGPADTDRLPTVCAEWTLKKEMHACLFTVTVA